MTTSGTMPKRNRNGWQHGCQEETPADPDLYDLFSEQELNYSAMTDPVALKILASEVQPEWFGDQDQRAICESIQRLHRAGKKVDPASVEADLRIHGKLDAIGGTGALHNAVKEKPLAYNAQSYAGQILRYWRKRRGRIEADDIRLMLESPVLTDDDLAEIESRLGIPNDFAIGKLFPILTSKELSVGQFDVDYLIDGMLVRGQNCILAGPKKALKTNIAIALALRLGIGGYLFNGDRWRRYHASKPVRVCIMSGESGAATIKETAVRIAVSMGWSLEQIENVLFCFSIPNLGESQHLQALELFVTENQIEVLILDPAYLMLPLTDNAGNLFAVGQLLSGLNKLADKTGLTTILIHHLKKSVFDPSNPPELEDIAWAGFQEFARQWILIGRRSPYDPERGGHHELWMNIGGSAGHSGLLALDIDEGARQDEGGRVWRVQALSAEEARFRAAEAAEERKEHRKGLQADASLESNRLKVLEVMEKFPDGETKNVIRTLAGMSGSKIDAVLSVLLQEGAAEECQFKKSKVSRNGFRLSRTVGQSGSDNSPSGSGSTRTDNSSPYRGECPSPSPTASQMNQCTLDINDPPESGGAVYAGEPSEGDF